MESYNSASPNYQLQKRYHFRWQTLQELLQLQKREREWEIDSGDGEDVMKLGSALEIYDWAHGVSSAKI